jgi:hypothetical protein
MMKYWIVILVAMVPLTGCMRDPSNLKDPALSYTPEKNILPALDQCIARNGQMVRCDQAK